MPIVNPVDEVLETEAPTNVQITAPAYRGVTVDTRYIPSSSLLTHIQGSSWSVQYFSQVLNDDNTVQGQQVNLNPIYQQYKLVRGFELKVTTPLTTSQSAETKSMVITGAANVYPFLIPNVGDMFIADIGDGREALFRVTMSERRAIFKDTSHFIEYQMIDYLTPERAGDLTSKVVQTLRFVRDFLNHGQNPLLQEEDFQLAKTLAAKYHEMVQVYFHSFMSNEFKTLQVPGQAFRIYDHFLAKAVKSYFSTWDAEQLRHMKLLNVDGDDAMKSINLWDVITTKRRSLLKVASRKAGLVSSKTFERNPMMEGIYHSGMHYVVYPKDPTQSVDYDAQTVKKLLATEVLVTPTVPPAELDELINIPVLDGLPAVDVDMIHPVLVDDYYVFSRAFYRNLDVGQSKLEIAVGNYLDGETLDNAQLLKFCNAYHSWGLLERFYYVPIVLMLIKASIRSI